MKTIIFDIGGTLINSLEFNFDLGLKELHQRLESKSPFEVWQQRNRDLYEYTFKTRHQHFLEIPFQSYLKFFLEGQNIKCDVSKMEIHFLKAAEKIEIMPNLKQCLTKLKDKYHIVALSNSTFSANALKSQLNSLGIACYFEEVYSSADYLFRKPCPLLFKQLLMIRGLNPNDVYMVGNDLNCDIIPAIQLGIKSFWYKEVKEEELCGELINQVTSFKDYNDLYNLLNDLDSE